MLNKDLLIVLVIYCSVTNKIGSLKHDKQLLPHTVSVRRESGSELSGSGSRSLTRCGQGQPGLHSSAGLTGAVGPISKTIYSHGCWQQAPVPHHVNLSTGLRE